MIKKLDKVIGGMTEKQIWIGIVIVSLLLFGLKQFNQSNDVEVNNLIQDDVVDEAEPSI